jgi:hypothetical protein
LSLPLRDPELVDKVSRAFAAHSWVSVKKVNKHYPPASKSSWNTAGRWQWSKLLARRTKLYFIDAASVLLRRRILKGGRAKRRTSSGSPR